MADYQIRARSSTEDIFWYRFVKCLVMEALERSPKSTRLHLVLAFLEHMKLENKYKALLHLTNTEAIHPSPLEEFAIYHLKKRIEQRMIE